MAQPVHAGRHRPNDASTPRSALYEAVVVSIAGLPLPKVVQRVRVDGPGAGLHKEMVALGIDEPVHGELVVERPAPAAAFERGAWRRVHREGEEIRRLREVGHEATV